MRPITVIFGRYNVPRTKKELASFISRRTSITRDKAEHMQVKRLYAIYYGLRSKE